MKLFKIIAIFIAVTCSIMSQSLKTPQDSIAYALGIDIGRNLSSSPLYENFDIKVMAKAMVESYTGSETISEDDYQRLVKAFQAFAQKKQAEMMASSSPVSSESFVEEQKAFLEENKKKEGVRTTSSGLQYKVINEGTGAMPNASQTVRVHYTGSLISGKVFDSSVERGKPIEFPLNGVIRGWTEGLQLMKEGAKYRFFIPANLGYGKKGAGRDIPGDATLIFDVELIKVL